MSNKRLYKVREGAMIAGVCQGIANYLNMDATVVRLLWAMITIFSFGTGFILYIACIFIIPDQLTVKRQQKEEQQKKTVFDSTEYKVKDSYK